MAPPIQSALDVAEYFLWLAANEQPDDPDYLTPAMLQKLLYFAQGWAMVEWGTPLFVEEIRATPRGPLVGEVARRYPGVAPVLDAPSSAPPMPVEAVPLLRALWSDYSRFSGSELSRVLRQEPVLIEAVASGAGEPGVIDPSRLRDAFLAKREETSRRFAENASALHQLAARNTESLRRRSAG